GEPGKKTLAETARNKRFNHGGAAASPSLSPPFAEGCDDTSTAPEQWGGRDVPPISPPVCAGCDNGSTASNLQRSAPAASQWVSCTGTRRPKRFSASASSTPRVRWQTGSPVAA